MANTMNDMLRTLVNDHFEIRHYMLPYSSDKSLYEKDSHRLIVQIGTVIRIPDIESRGVRRDPCREW